MLGSNVVRFHARSVMRVLPCEGVAYALFLTLFSYVILLLVASLEETLQKQLRNHYFIDAEIAYTKAKYSGFLRNLISCLIFRTLQEYNNCYRGCLRNKTAI